MAAYLLRRLTLGVGVLFVATFGLFWVIASRINPLWPYLLNPPKNPQVLADAKTRAGVGMSIRERYWHWLEGAVHLGSFGRATVIDNNPVWPAVWFGLRQTAALAGCSVIVIVIFSLLLGTLAARRPGSATDVVLRRLGYVTWSIPVFLGLQEVFLRIGLFGLHPFGSFFHFHPATPGAAELRPRGGHVVPPRDAAGDRGHGRVHRRIRPLRPAAQAASTTPSRVATGTCRERRGRSRSRRRPRARHRP